MANFPPSPPSHRLRKVIWAYYKVHLICGILTPWDMTPSSRLTPLYLLLGEQGQLIQVNMHTFLLCLEFINGPSTWEESASNRAPCPRQIFLRDQIKENVYTKKPLEPTKKKKKLQQNETFLIQQRAECYEHRCIADFVNV